MKYKIIYCDYIGPLSEKSWDYQKNGALVLRKSKKGYIFDTYLKAKSVGTFKKSNLGQFKEYDFREAIALPTFFDMHFHWVQDDVRTMPKDSLLDWLSNYTWPSEAKFKDQSFSSNKARHFSKELIKAGTLGGAVYSSLHPHSVDHGFDDFLGDFIIGHVLMSMNSPDYLNHSSKDALKMVKEYFKKYKNKYALTPRFAPTTDPNLMKQGASIAKKYRGFIQTHLAETPQEIDYVLGIYKHIKDFEKVKSYTEIYHKCGVLGPRTIMGHGIYLSKDEWELIKKTKTVIAHCPTSNAPVNELGLGSGLFNLKEARKRNIRWVLASDIGGGPYLSMLDVMDSFLKQHERAKVKVTAQEALYRSTLAGAEVLGVAKTSGSITPGKFANFVLFPKASDATKAETQMRDLLGIVGDKRERYLDLSLATFYKGELISSTIGQ